VGVDVGPSATAGVPRTDTVKATAMSGGKRYRCTGKVQTESAARPSETGHKSPERACEGCPRYVSSPTLPVAPILFVVTSRAS
jgi:hypothetical protein